MVTRTFDAYRKEAQILTRESITNPEAITVKLWRDWTQTAQARVAAEPPAPPAAPGVPAPFRAKGKPSLKSLVFAPGRPDGPAFITWRELRDTGGAGTSGGTSRLSIQPEGFGLGDTSDEDIERYISDLGVSSQHFNPQMAPERRTFQEIPGLTPQEWPALPKHRKSTDPKNSTDPEIQAFMTSDIGQKNIEKVLAMATPEERDYWTRWYPGAHAIAWRLAKRYNVSLAVAAGVLAALSPQEDWVNNVALANAALAGDWPNVKTLGLSRRKAWTLINERDFSAIRGDKVHRFFMSIYSPQQFQNEVVVDTHAAAIWLGRRLGKVPSISAAIRAKMDMDYKAAAATFGMTPQGAQALSWVLWRGIQSTESGKATGTKSIKGRTEGIMGLMGLSAGLRIRLASLPQSPPRAILAKMVGAHLGMPYAKSQALLNHEATMTVPARFMASPLTQALKLGRNQAGWAASPVTPEDKLKIKELAVKAENTKRPIDSMVDAFYLGAKKPD